MSYFTHSVEQNVPGQNALAKTRYFRKITVSTCIYLFKPLCDAGLGLGFATSCRSNLACKYDRNETKADNECDLIAPQAI